MDVDDEAILTFISITGATPETAQSYLQVSEGNVNAAVSLFLESGGQDLSSHTGASLDQGIHTNDDFETGTGVRWETENEIRAPIAPKHEVLVGGDYGTEEDWEHEVVRPPVRRARSRPEVASGSAFSSSEVGSSSDKSSRLTKMFEPPYDIMFDGDFDHARHLARSTSKWILITVSDRTEFVCEALKRDLWNKSEIKQFIKERFIFIFHMSHTEEGRKHLTFYPVDHYPYFAIVDPRTGERVKKWHESLSPQEFMQEVEEFLEMHSLTSDEGRKKKKKKQDVPVSELSEEDQLRLALAASMGSEAVEIQEAELTVEAKDPTLLIKGNVRDEPLAGDTTRLQFRMPDGSRQVRKFLKSDKVLYLFEFVKGVCAEVASKPFELLNFRDALSSKMEESLESAKVLNASINIELKE